MPDILNWPSKRASAFLFVSQGIICDRGRMMAEKSSQQHEAKARES